MGTFLKRVGTGLKTICGCVSAARQQARQSEIDIPSQRSFRLMYTSRKASPALLQDAVTGLQKVATRTRVRLGAFLDCLYDARKSAEQSKTDPLRRRSHRRLPH